jgi:hypothetical protein
MGWRGPLFRRLAMSDDYIPEKDAAQAARWAAKWRDLAEEALAVAETMGDPEARRHMLFIAEAYKLLAERAKERSVRLVCGLA